MNSTIQIQVAVGVLVVVGVMVILASRYRQARRTGVGLRGARDRLLVAGAAAVAVLVGALITFKPFG